jgi:hypothetical protein
VQSRHREHVQQSGTAHLCDVLVADCIGVTEDERLRHPARARGQGPSQRRAHARTGRVEHRREPRLLDQLDRSAAVDPGAALWLEAWRPRRMRARVAERRAGRDMREDPDPTAGW